ncbi:glycosyltransferase [Bifidobacterium psychraerophilum]|uniref:Glycosyl transferase, group 2 family protein n=1 Tax=Bifidobacterium psychraerophilum TaxID=218140 RepID=A0A087CJ42_9BIFI|nr:glycosyltransferase [Bifidobacterium psychraerophilum]KFI83292.1 glycosyl transferase, group 2 family protein [Bifidobacterium psychraerophilum]PKA94347.1 rhamnosyltransferase [Bifidobacterium psychraerophilum DSM 22366]
MSIAGITTFEPNLNRLRENLNSIAAQVDRIIIVDNGSSNIDSISSLTTEYGEVVSMCMNSANLGVANALNRIVNLASDTDEDWVLLLDQDSVASPGMFDTLARYRSPTTAILSPLVVDINRPHPQKTNTNVEHCMWPITSGSLLNIGICRELGYFNEDLFIDFVDDEYAIRAFLAGYESLRVNTATLYHEVGHLKAAGIPFPHYEKGRWMLRRAFDSGHTPLRHYYQIRNLLYLRKQYNSVLQQHGVQLPSAIKYYIHSVFFEPHKFQNITEMNRGIVDFRGLFHSSGNQQ